MTKVCGKCGVEKDFNQYQKQKNGKYGLYSICKDCVKERKRAYYESHREHEKERAKTYAKTYYESHKEYIKERAKIYRDNHKEHREYRINQKKIYNENIREKSLDLYGHKCELCGSVDHLEFHHLNLDGGEERKVYSHKNLYRSLADGNKRSDLQLLCRSCHHKIHNDLRSSI